MFDLVTVGDIIIDYTPIENIESVGASFAANVGGTAANCAAAASKLGLKTRLVGTAGDDFMGAHAREVLASCNVDTKTVVDGLDMFTSHTFVSLLNGERSFSFSIRGSAYPTLGIDDIDLDDVLDTEMLYVSGMDVVDGPIYPTMLRIVEEAVRRKIPIALDLNYRAFLYEKVSDYTERILDLLPSITFLKGATEEFEAVFGSQSLCEVGPRITAAGPELVVMTEDANGASFYWQGVTGHVDGLRPGVVDTTGAGDCFMGAIIFAIHQAGGLKNLDLGGLETAVKFANTAAAISTEGFGAIAPLPDLQTIKQWQQSAANDKMAV